MLNLWIGYKDFENLEDYPDIYFDSYTDLVLNASRLGENCELFLKEIADEEDVTLITTRYFNPFLLCDYDKVRILNTGDIVTTSREFLGVYYNNDLNIELYGE